jgi:hypothetical protein
MVKDVQEDKIKDSEKEQEEKRMLKSDLDDLSFD